VDRVEHGYGRRKRVVADRKGYAAQAGELARACADMARRPGCLDGTRVLGHPSALRNRFMP
jgi:hypothetical protein